VRAEGAAATAATAVAARPAPSASADPAAADRATESVSEPADAPSGRVPPEADVATQAAAIMVAVRAPDPVSQTRLELHTVAPFMQRVTDKQASIARPA
jgi:hypothetical protein